MRFISIFFIFIPFLTSIETALVPISIPVRQLKASNNEKQCSIPNGHSCGNVISQTLCGENCWSTRNKLITYEYTFEGEGFQVYGTYAPQHHRFEIHLDGEKLTTIDQYRTTRTTYSLQFTSELLPYGNHTIKLVGIGEVYEIHKITFWPSLNSIRVNSTDIGKSWKTKSDGMGGLFEYLDVKSDAVKTTSIIASKIWLYGTQNSANGRLKFTINGQTHSINQESANEGINVLLFKSEFDVTECILEISPDDSSGVKTVEISCIYFVPAEQNPISSTPAGIPISVSVDYMKINGPQNYGTTYSCNNNAPTEVPCGNRCWTSYPHNTTFEYTFKGEMFQVFGTFDQRHHRFHLFLDGVFVKEIDQYSLKRTEFALQYTSDLLPYGEHRIKVAGIGETFEIYKFTYWPSVRAIRLNASSMSPGWFKETDNIGGIREHTKDSNAVKTAVVTCSKIWLYGTVDPFHGVMTFSIDNMDFTINQNSKTRVDNALLFESDFLPFGTHTIKCRRSTLAVLLWCIYYIPPLPTQTPTPLPTPTESMKFSNSDYFTNSKVFSFSMMFSHSSLFSNSKEFSESKQFSISDEFSDSDFFSKSNLFSKSGIFSDSFLFTKSDVFSESFIFSNSVDFSESDTFSLSSKFSDSCQFTSHYFSPSNSFDAQYYLNEQENTVKNSKNKKASLIVGISIGVVALILICSLAAIFVRRAIRNEDEGNCGNKIIDTNASGMASAYEDNTNPIYNDDINNSRYPYNEEYEEDY